MGFDFFLAGDVVDNCAIVSGIVVYGALLLSQI